VNRDREQGRADDELHAADRRREPGKPIEGVEELVAHFAAAGKPRADWRIGVEHEKIGVLAESGAPVPYHGERGIAALLERLVRERDWIPQREGDHVIALARGPERVTIEPGGQLELSGAPFASHDEIRREIGGHLAELAVPSRDLGIEWLAIGFRPFGTLDDIAWVPKGRYAVMRRVLPARGAHAHDMMKRTATVQANLDWLDEDDAERKLRTAMSVTSIVTALFASSPLVDGADSGYASYRARAWLDTDPDRCGLLPFAFERGGLFSRYVEWALDVPLLFFYDGEYHEAGGVTFRRFLREGFRGRRPTMAEWELHLSTLFPEARLKQYLEVRGADAGSLAMVYALPALWRGLLYHDDASAAASALTAGLSFADRAALREAIPLQGLRARAGGHTVLELARELVSIARSALSPEDAMALDPVDEIVATGVTQSDRIRALFHAAHGDPHALTSALRLVTS
jgi:glutamate--cysteine ligase